jgi:hypothetical protein
MRFIQNPSRRFVLTRTVAGVFAAVMAPPLTSAQTPPAQQPPAIPKRPDPLSPTLVREFVGKAHGDLAATKALLAETPGLLNATWDWGGGDFEMGIGGAGHMGNRDIAEFLIAQGGRMDIFVAAMLGKLDIVKAMLDAYPALLNSKGPHGIPLMVHAKKGGTAAEAVVAFLESRGLRPGTRLCG